MAKRPKTIITCAITGAIHTPTMSDALPYAAEDIAAQAIAAAAAGAAILHLPARRPTDGGVSIYPDDFAAFLPRVKLATGAVVNIYTGGSLKNTIEERIAPALRFSPEMCSLKRTADRLFGDDYRWSVLGAGGAQMGLATTASQIVRQCACGAGRQPANRPRHAGYLQCTTGCQIPPDHRRPWLRGGQPG